MPVICAKNFLRYIIPYNIYTKFCLNTWKRSYEQLLVFFTVLSPLRADPDPDGWSAGLIPDPDGRSPDP